MKRPHNLTIEQTVDWLLENSVKTATGCMECHLGIDKDGYSELRFNYKRHRAARFVFGVINGLKPECVCHSCDNRKCINPDHLWAGTNKDNTRDMHSKNRNADVNGDKNAMAKITNEQAIEIRNRFIKGVPWHKGNTEELMNEYNLSRHSIYNIVNRVTFKNV